MACDNASNDRSISRWAERLAAADTYRLTWAPSAVSVMKRVPRLARLHKQLGALLDVPEG